MYWNFTGLLAGVGDVPLRADRLVVEIGFGNGEYLAHLARTREDALVVGIEVSQWCVCKAARRLLAEGLKNARLVHGDARYLLRKIFEPEAIGEVYMNFPCPWPKTRHAGRRVTSPQFASLLLDCLAPGGTFILATDVDWYAEATRVFFDAEDAFKAGAMITNPARDYVSKYERKWKAMDKDTYVLRVEKTGRRAGGGNMSEYEVNGMDESMGGSIDVDELAALLRPLDGVEINGRNCKSILREAFIAADGSALVAAISVDEGFEQHFYIRVVPTQRGLRAKVDAVGHPYRTPGVRACFNAVVQAIKGE